MGKEIPRVAQDEHKAGELTQAWMIDKTPINLRLFPRKKSEGMINLPLLAPKRAGILDYKGIARIYPPPPCLSACCGSDVLSKTDIRKTSCRSVNGIFPTCRVSISYLRGDVPHISLRPSFWEPPSYLESDKNSDSSHREDTIFSALCLLSLSCPPGSSHDVSMVFRPFRFCNLILYLASPLR